ncbi:hypothetical protein [Bradyrhizobium sp.]|jgi:hypothetical protein|uniref:hypothetical protein n=1 Tax=Bradyrhizobium sp. TaxID=376 RepID=UPI003C26ABED
MTTDSGALSEDSIEVIKVLAATCVFVSYLFLIEIARGKAALAAGMLLTFPAINGITLLVADFPSATAKAETMIPMIAFNGVMCLGFVLAFISLYERASPDRLPILRWALLSVAGAAWFIAALLGIPISSRHQAYLVSGYLIVAIAFVAAVSPVSKPAAPPSLQTPWRESLRKLTENRQFYFRIAWFIATLSLVLFAAALRQEKLVGALGAAPLLPLFGLFALAKNEDPLPALRTIRATVLLGPVIAMTFVAGFSAFVDRVNPSVGLLLLLFGWVLCLLAIWFVSAVVFPRLR